MRLHTLAVGIFATCMLASSQQAPPPQYDAGAQQDAAGPPDEPGRPVARLSVMSGDASVRRGDSGEWVAAALNAPLMAGGCVSCAPRGATGLELGSSTFARLSGESPIRVWRFGTRQVLFE